jgi:hypothetical protein
MPLLQSINAKRFRTFGEMALDFVKNQISCFQFTSVVVNIFDRCDIQNSIKKAKRDRRSKSISPKVLNLFAFIDCNKGMSSDQSCSGNIKKWAVFVLLKRSVPVDVQDLPYWF